MFIVTSILTSSVVKDEANTYLFLVGSALQRIVVLVAVQLGHPCHHLCNRKFKSRLLGASKSKNEMANETETAPTKLLTCTSRHMSDFCSSYIISYLGFIFIFQCC